MEAVNEALKLIAQAIDVLKDQSLTFNSLQKAIFLLEESVDKLAKERSTRNVESKL